LHVYEEKAEVEKAIIIIAHGLDSHINRFSEVAHKMA
jgi:hypothetical protein